MPLKISAKHVPTAGPGGTAGPRPTLPMGGRIGDVFHRTPDISAFERPRCGAGARAHPRSGAALRALLTAMRKRCGGEAP
ncbi:hypothetical protein Za10_1328 [Zymomonas mobilis subsp. mobilis NCIMB 11163]|nr:hypothetical protein Za10_1328 [Zymomonas mobilis subsp. mobilis NCIMB 11163]